MTSRKVETKSTVIEIKIETISEPSVEATVLPDSRPTHAKRAIVFGLKDADAVLQQIDAFQAGEESSGGAIGMLLEYMQGHPDASLQAVAPAQSDVTVSGPTWSMSLPDPLETPGPAIHLVRGLPDADVDSLVAKLRTDGRTIAFAERPGLQYPLGARRRPQAEPCPEPEADPQWYKTRCRFADAVFPVPLDVSALPGRVAIIDAGIPTHTAVTSRMTPKTMPKENASSASHAGAVASVISAETVNTEAGMFSGCCDADIDAYNVFCEDGFDYAAYYTALVDVARSNAAVLNLSLGGSAPDTAVFHLLNACMNAGVVVIAAAGDDRSTGSPPLYPAAFRRVIAVGGTDGCDNPTKSSTQGKQVHICAPAESILTLLGNDGVDEENGTSFACAIVSAAVWFAKRSRPSLNQEAIRDLLAVGVNIRGAERTDDRGFGRLDVVRFAAAII